MYLSWDKLIKKAITTFLYFILLIYYNKLACCMGKSVDPDQLASLEASWSGSTLFSKEYISGFIMFSKKVNTWYSTVRAKLSNLFFGTSKIFFGQVHYGHLLVPGQAVNFAISTPLVKWITSWTTHNDTSGHFCHLLLTFTVRTQIRTYRMSVQNVRLDLDPHCLMLWLCYWKIFFENVDFEKCQQMTTKMLMMTK